MQAISNIHPLTEWIKSRLDEMDASLAVFEKETTSMAADLRRKADATFVDMRKRRDVFYAEAKKTREANEEQWAATQSKLDAEFRAFEDDIETHWHDIGDTVKSHEALFKARATSQMKAWHDTEVKFETLVKTVEKDRRHDIDAAVTKAKLVAQHAMSKLDDINASGKASWSALRAALTESRSAFDTANAKISAAVKKAFEG